MLGRDLAEAATAAGHAVAGLDLPDFDLTRPDHVRDRLPPAELVINCAAYTAVDAAETDRAAADAVNALAPARLASVCAERDLPLFHLSTDYVFDGESDRPYREDDPPHPLNAYGAGKLEGEQRVLEAGGPSLVIRVQSLFGRHGEHFIRKIMRRLEAGPDEVRVVDDQVTSPTYTRHLALAILRLVGAGHTGRVHLAAAGSCSWYEFAREAARALGREERIRPVPSSAFPTPARRPARALLDTARFQAWTGQALPTWQQGLHDYLEEGKVDA